MYMCIFAVLCNLLVEFLAKYDFPSKLILHNICSSNLLTRMCNIPEELSMRFMAWAWESVPHGCSLMEISSSASRNPALHALLRLRT